MNPYAHLPTVPPKAILVVCVRYLGDTLLLRPALRALRTAFPEARIDALITEGTACALDDCKDVSRVLEWPRRAWLRELALLARISCEGYGWVVDFTGNDRSALVALLSRAPFRTAYERPKLSKWSLRRTAYHFRPAHRKAKPHTVIQRLELLEACGVASCGVGCDLVPRPEALAWAHGVVRFLPKPLLHVHVTSRDMQKAIPSDVVRAVVERTIDAGGGVVVTCGKAEIEASHIAKCLARLPAEKVLSFDSLTWHQLVALISLCDKYWGADTAPAHVASALEKPLLIHFGPSRSDHWYPLHPAGKLDVQACECLSKKAKTKCPPGRPGACLERLDAKAIFAALAAL